MGCAWTEDAPARACAPAWRRGRHHSGATGETGFLGSPKEGRTVVELEAWVCRSCAFVELYARDLAVLEEVARTHESITLVDRSEDGGPFR